MSTDKNYFASISIIVNLESCTIVPIKSQKGEL